MTSSADSNTRISDKKAQQRQILALMGIDVWASVSTPTVLIDYDTSTRSSLARNIHNEIHSDKAVEDSSISSSNPVVSTSISSTIATTHNLNISTAPTSTSASTLNVSSSKDVAADISNSNTHNPNVVPAAAMSIEPSIEPSIEASIEPPQFENKTSINTAKSVKDNRTVAPFEIIGSKYRNNDCEWVFLVDKNRLSDELQLALWNNIIQALSLKPEHLKFPICSGIDDEESARASMAGFMFRLAKSDNINIVTLTPMPEGVELDTVFEMLQGELVQLPYLSQMLADGLNKRKFWQRLTQ